MDGVKFNISLITKATKNVNLFSKRKGRGGMRRTRGTGSCSSSGRIIDIVRTDGGRSIF